MSARIETDEKALAEGTKGRIVRLQRRVPRP